MTEQSVTPSILEGAATSAPDGGPKKSSTPGYRSDRRGAIGRAWESSRRTRPVIVLTLALFIFVSITQSSFLTSQNLQNLLTAVSVLWLIALAQTFAMLTGGIDLSMGALAALVSVFLGKLLGGSLPEWSALVLALLFGTAIGALINGMLIGRAKLSFFIVTLATATTMGGVVLIWSNQESKLLIGANLINDLSIEKFAGIAAPIWIMAITLVIALYVQRRTYFGRNLYAVGGSAAAARLSGIRVERTTIAVFGICGFCAALAGVVGTGQVGAATPVVNQTIALQAIAAVLLGGTSLFGGSGGVGGTALGVLFIGVLQNALNLSGVAIAWQEVVTGVILIAAIIAIPSATGGGRLTLVRRILRRGPAGGTPAEASTA
jgi:ribose transport system permease protein